MHWTDEPQTPLMRLADAAFLINSLLPELTEESRAKADKAVKLLVLLSNGEIKFSEGRGMCVETRPHDPNADPRQEAIRLMYERYSWPQEIHPSLAANPKVLATVEACRFADYILDRPDELAETIKRAEVEKVERDRAWKEHQAKQPPKEGPA